MAVLQTGGKIAVTNYKTLKTFKHAASLVQCNLETGRTHQLRVHAASPEGLGCPIVGDRLYSPGGMTRQNPMHMPEGHLMLHAQSIEFIHPFTGEIITLSAPMPAYF